MAETILALTGAAVCFALLVHMFLPPRWRRPIDQGLRQLWLRLRTRRGGVPRPARRTDLRAANKPHMPRMPRVPERRGERQTGPRSEFKTRVETEHEVLREAEQEAQDVIERARRLAREGKPVERDGNVYRPDAFKPRPPQDKLH